MPYIDKQKRKMIDEAVVRLAKTAMETDSAHIEGVLNYCITRLIMSCLPKLQYADINRMIGMLECCKLELYRRVAAPYEDEKCKANGDCYNRASDRPTKMYSIGQEYEPGSFGMHHGPHPDINEMRKVYGSPNDYIFELDPINGDRELYKWDPASHEWTPVFEIKPALLVGKSP